MSEIGSHVVVRLKDSGIPEMVSVDGVELHHAVQCKFVAAPGELTFVELKILVAHFVTERAR